ncbi:MAG: chemotaxis response regulator protein-glutamate methylesterase [Gemmatimonadetes bacterium]|nr:MAG: chemotaxis response regulator protein-glutamate methylesterase [Gemmatimonadota bacterium]
MIRLLVVDDSAVVRKILSEELSKFEDIEVVGTAMDPYVARERIVELEPDVLTLDVEMPRMDGLSFLKKLMKHHPMPVVVVSSLTPENSENALRALELGAVEVIPKPGSQFSVPDVGRHLVRAIRAAARANLHGVQRARVDEDVPAPALQGLSTTHQVLAIGASTGGTRAIEAVLRRCPPDLPGTVIVQHMPQGFTTTYAQRMDRICPQEVREARDGDILAPGTVLIAPGGKQMLVKRSGAQYRVQVKEGPPVNHHRPSVDVLFRSVARSCGANAVGLILTGMGADGARGLKEMRDAGARTIVQDEASCVVFGMPAAAIEMGAAEQVLGLGEIPQALLGAFAKRQPAMAGV